MSKKSVYTYFPVLVLFLFYIFAGLYGHVNLFKICQFLIYQIFIFLLGYNFQNILKVTHKNSLISIFCSYAIGYVITILIYAILLIINIQFISKYFYWTLFIINLVFYVFNFFYTKNKVNINDETKSNSIYVTAILFLTLLISFFTYQYVNRSPEEIGYNNLYGDLSYCFKNAVAVTKGYPIPELSVNGLKLYWHLFSCFEIASLYFFTGIDIYSLCFIFQYIWQFFLLVGGIYVLFRVLTNNTFYLKTALVILLFTSSFEFITYVYYLEHLYRCSLAFIEGYSISMFCFYFLTLFFPNSDSQKINYNYFFPTLILFVGALGLKAPCGCIILIGVGIFYFVNLPQNYKSRLFYITGIVFLISFFIVSKLFIIDGNALSSDSSSHKLSISLYKTVLRTPAGNKGFNILTSLGFPKIIAFILTFFIYLFSTNYIIIPLFLFTCIFVIIKKMKIDYINISLFVMSVVGLLLFLFVDHPGFSQVYFIFEVMIFILLFSYRISECYNLEKKLSFKTIILSLIFISITTYSIFFMRNMNLTVFEYQTHEHLKSKYGDDVSRKELEGLKWCRNNLPENAVLLTNKLFCENPFRTFATSSHSERQVYLEGWGSTNLPNMDLVTYRTTMTKLYYEGNTDVTNKLKAEGVTHSVVFKSLFYSDSISGELIFDNEDFSVYKL